MSSVNPLTSTLQLLLGINDNSKDALLNYLLQAAEAKLLSYIFPYDTEATLPQRYDYKVVEIAQYLYNRLGTEGETSHNELGSDGLQQTFEDGGLPPSLFRDIPRKAGITRGETEDEP